MSAWSMLSGPRPFDTGDGREIDIGWGWTIARDGETRPINVEVDVDPLSTSRLPEQCELAMHTEGWSAISGHMNEDVPPRLIRVTCDGLRTVYEYRPPARI